MTHEDDYTDLESCGGDGAPGVTRFRVRIDDERYRIEDPKPTGRQLLALTDRKPIDEYLLFLILRGGGFEEIRLDETVDLTRPGVERFLSFESSASYRFEIDGERIEWGAKLITGLKIKQIAKVDPATYALWREVRGGEDLPVKDDDLVDLSEDGLERFFTVIEQTTAGDDGGALPRRDHAYLVENDIMFEEVVEDGQIGIVLKDYGLPNKHFDAEKTDILILLPAGYPDTAPDMFHCLPWLRLASGGSFPHCADYPVKFAGQSWQRWSRHNNQWRAGKDGIWTMIKRVACALEEAA
jgi:E2/UBC family protein E/multiubiquitin